MPQVHGAQSPVQDPGRAVREGSWLLRGEEEETVLLNKEEKSKAYSLKPDPG